MKDMENIFQYTTVNSRCPRNFCKVMKNFDICICCIAINFFSRKVCCLMSSRNSICFTEINIETLEIC
ncbi:uncharacterized protein LACBIDRAFT_309680 [Laccaria bicolor S238N-H82]|uniref:Predicted protein n=1 Tax=Laccaria bicolor (strain S238N-H82 / ATCC MYA-4686) TaxID=486041 RepID=B0DST8_LACBS|nr:uncharacterized protein LACBIDRAFT_309680 [Laccaria bicolor S238N-H82]EDR02297.1 predicted protein [Laccaria bicolor S238N-H82]|eukprot:XP_001886974.1 predicted protein [Laccaria bicolor S238N-H82]